MNNIGTIISTHNKKMLSKKETTEYGCNCRNKDSCPLENKCLTPQLIYKAEVANNINTDIKSYIGLSETPFKVRFRNHTKDFKHKKYSKSTELSKYIWSLKESNIEPSIRWSILHKVHTNKVKCNYCKLCLTEKLYILNSSGTVNSFNSRTEFINKCRHQNKLLLKSLMRKDSLD